MPPFPSKKPAPPIARRPPKVAAPAKSVADEFYPSKPVAQVPKVGKPLFGGKP